ncbi:DUF4177 domain-containing protein [Luteimonas sp. Y-2-2-4F]|nr:DUF4177 domain-containing protein [Luteimonas sp. Y-2-2-4F]MCD9033510.1 DUF4177 domain-containing protein [Luteimonas sp. Y-2-2-4F]
MSERWQHKVVEVPAALFGGKLTRRLQEALDKLGVQGWELVAVTQSSSLDVVRLYLKKGL